MITRSSPLQTPNRQLRRKLKAERRRAQRRARRFAAPLLSAFLAFQAAAPLSAQPPTLVAPEVRLRYMYYTEHQSDGTERMTIEAPMAMVRQNLDPDNSIEGVFTYDGISGASPFYLDSVSSASIRDSRTEGQIKYSHRSGNTLLNTTVFTSDEDDYKSLAGTVDAIHSIENTDTQITAGISHSADEVSSTLYLFKGRNRDTTSASAGIVQILDEDTMLSSGVSFAYSQGYLSDPYKSLDNRPDSRSEVIWMNRMVHYVAALDGSIHADLRLASDDWGINSQTLELSYYQPFMEEWLIRPVLRYYSQHKATFFKDNFPPDLSQTGYYSADQRMGTFGSLTPGIRLQRNFCEDWSLDFSVDWMQQRSEWSLQGGSGSQFQALHAVFYGVGLLKRF